MEHWGCPLLILAGAGSGKTRAITTKIAFLAERRSIPPWSMLAVTFTNKAAQEMRDRATAMLPAAAEANIRTFHSFCNWLLRRYGSRAGIDPRPRRPIPVWFGGRVFRYWTVPTPSRSCATRPAVDGPRTSSRRPPT